MIGVHPCYVLVTTFMVGMATATIERLCGSHATVKAALALDIRRDFLMAIHTKGRLIGLVETDMALVAVVLELGMTLSQLAW